MNSFVFHSVGVAVERLNEAVPKFKDLFGYDLVSGPFDDPIRDVSVCFLSRAAGDPFLELVAPLGPNSPVDRTLKPGVGTYHVCYEVPDLDAAIAHLAGQDSMLVTAPAPAIAFEMGRSPG